MTTVAAISEKTVPNFNWDSVKYPRLGRHKQQKFVVLFDMKGKGTIVFLPAGNTSWTFSQYIKAWDMLEFEPFYGTVTLTD